MLLQFWNKHLLPQHVSASEIPETLLASFCPMKLLPLFEMALLLISLASISIILLSPFLCELTFIHAFKRKKVMKTLTSNGKCEDLAYFQKFAFNKKGEKPLTVLTKTDPTDNTNQFPKDFSITNCTSVCQVMLRKWPTTDKTGISSISVGWCLKHFNCWYGQDKTAYSIIAECVTESQ